MVAQTRTLAAGKRTGKDLLLRRALVGNVLFSTISGVLMIAASSWISEFTGLTPGWLPAAIGVGVLIWAADVAVVARSQTLRPSRIWLVIGGDLAWVVLSYGILIAGTPDLTSAGAWAFGILAEIVGLFAVVQYLGLRRMRS